MRLASPFARTGAKERPILMSAPMVRAILAGTKTQTRRVMARQKKHDFTDYTLFGQQGHPDDEAERRGGWARPWVAIEQAPDWPDGKDDQCACPYASHRGDRLWVRENGWERPERTLRMMREGGDTLEPYYFDADGISDQEAADFKAWGFKRRPSIHMPRKACRLVLEVTGIRVERLHEISEADCRAEGCHGGHGSIPGYAYNATPREHYQAVWAALNGASSWQANSWVWVIEFKRTS